MTYTIQQAVPADTETIRQLAEDTWWPTYSPILEKKQIEFMLAEIYAAEKINKQIATGQQTFLLLLEADKPVAFAAYSPRDENPDIYKLHKLYCHPQSQGKGYGKILVDQVIANVKKAGKHTLDLNVNKHNKALSFYQKMGFEIAYEENIPIGPYWMNDFVMRKHF